MKPNKISIWFKNYSYEDYIKNIETGHATLDKLTKKISKQYTKTKDIEELKKLLNYSDTSSNNKINYLRTHINPIKRLFFSFFFPDYKTNSGSLERARDLRVKLRKRIEILTNAQEALNDLGIDVDTIIKQYENNKQLIKIEKNQKIDNTTVSINMKFFSKRKILVLNKKVYVPVNKEWKGGIKTQNLYMNIKTGKLVMLGASQTTNKVHHKIQEEMTINELKIHKKLQDKPGIVKFKGDVKLESGDVGIVTKYYHGENLRNKLANSNLSLEEKLDYIKQISTAIQSMHNKAIYHRDISSDNIIVDKKKGAFLLDFDSAFDMQNDLSDSKEKEMQSQAYGKKPYAAPEIQDIRDEENHLTKEARENNIQHATRKLDIYSTGIIFYEIVYGFPPELNFKSDKDCIEKLYKEIDKNLNNNPTPLDKLILAMLDKNPDNRPTADEIVKQLNLLESDDLLKKIEAQDPPLSKNDENLKIEESNIKDLNNDLKIDEEIGL